ncbi:hypothetical protein [Microbacterium sp. ZW T5_56]|uniref:hypothetical protein n=1 Tax=Microbacterium sp. ZW T5_56 TaxID=3378081 RepID=UPI0038540303
METYDRLDHLLQRSAPPDLTVGDELTRALDQTTHAARAQIFAEKPRTRRTPRVLAGLGLAIVLMGGAGTAVASGGLSWLPWAQHPDAVYAFTLPSGRECELRSVVVEPRELAGDWAGFVASVGDLHVDDALVKSWADRIRSDPQTRIQIVNADGEWEDPTGDTPPTDDDIYAIAHRVAMAETVAQLAEQAEVSLAFEGNEQLLCEAVTS